MTRSDLLTSADRAGPLGLRAVASGARGRLWAPEAAAVAVVAHPGGARERTVPATRGARGVWDVEVRGLAHADRYLIEVDGARVPDPWARGFPEGCDRPPALVDPAAIGAQGERPRPPARSLRDAVLYELHVGTFTPAGTLDAAVERLDHLAELGVTHIELMPVAAFPGDRGWGYDGIFWQAVHHAYGGPGALVRLVDAAHERGLAVVLDVVFNHIGPTGDRAWDAFGPFFTDRHRTPWGRAINVDGPGADLVRETIFQAAEHWLATVGVDGLRVDACHAIVDQSAHHVLAELVERARQARPDAVLIAESGLNDPRTLHPAERGGWGFDADWADDLHHALRTVLTNERRAWLSDFGTVAQVAAALHRPYVHAGTYSAYRDRRFGAPADDIEPWRFVVFAQNHDQVGNRPVGDRLPSEARPLAAMLTLLGSATPMLFQGEELDDDAPFAFFTDHRDPFIADATREGRRREFADWAAEAHEAVPDPQDPATFERSKLTWRDDERARTALARYRRMIELRAEVPRIDAEVSYDEEARWVRADLGHWSLVASFATEAAIVPCPGGEVAFATHPQVPEAVGRGGGIALPPLGGALVHTGGSR